MGRFLVLILLCTIIIGAVLSLQFPLNWVGHLPGDFVAYWHGHMVIIPLASAFVFSLVLSAILFLVGKR